MCVCACIVSLTYLQVLFTICTTNNQGHSQSIFLTFCQALPVTVVTGITLTAVAPVPIP